MAKQKTKTSVLASPAKLRAIADHLERTVREQVAELRRLADLGDGAANVMAKTAATPKKAKLKKRVVAKRIRKAPRKKAAKKVARRSAKVAQAPAPTPAKTATKKAATKHQAKHQAKAAKPLRNGHDRTHAAASL